MDLFPSLVFLDYISPFNICCKAGLVVLSSFNFYLSEKHFISPSILNEILAGYSNLGCRFFSFSTLNISCHSLLACRVSAERSAVKRMGFPLYDGSDSEASVYNAGDQGSIPGSGRSLREGNGNSLQYSCVENPMDREAWQAAFSGVSKSQTQMSN